jgi:hypothetical protein
LGGSGRHGNSRRGRRNAAALREEEEENGVLVVDSGWLQLVLGVQEVEAVTALLFPGSARRGVVGVVVNVELLELGPWRRCGERQRGGRRRKTAADRGG